MKQFCTTCGKSEVVRSRKNSDILYCTNCMTVYEEMGDELVKMDVGAECKYNVNVLCNPLDRLAHECYTCGWCPKVAEQRVKEVREKYQ